VSPGGNLRYIVAKEACFNLQKKKKSGGDKEGVKRAETCSTKKRCKAKKQEGEVESYPKSVWKRGGNAHQKASARKGKKRFREETGGGEAVSVCKEG